MFTMPDATVLPGVVAAVAIAATANAGGGYLPTTWGWAIAGPASVALAALVVRSELRITRTAVGFLLLLGAVVAWTAASLLWTDSVPRTAAEVQRDLVYLATVAALVVLPRSPVAILAGTLTAICGVSIAALATLLFPERYGLDSETAFRLSRPLGYWNALGLLVAVGAVLALGVVGGGRTRAVRAAAAAALVPLLATLFATLSRGAWLALAAGFVVALVLHSDPRRFAAGAAIGLVPAVVGVGLLASADELTAAPSSLAAATSQGNRIALVLAALALLATATPWALDALATRLPPLPRPPRRVLAWAAVCIVGVSIAATAALAGRAYDSFRTPQTFGTQGADARLLSLSGQNRAEYWDVAFDDYGAHPLLGSGAGTYDLYWTRDRPFGVGARDAHSLYVEALAELGPVGLALLLAALAAPFFALPRVRDRWYAAPLAGAYAAFLVHAGVDWDWELPTVTIAALACAAALATSSAQSVVVRMAVRTAAAVAAAALVLVALAVQVGNNALAASEAALRSGNHDEAVTAAARASRWAPWTAEAWQVRSDAERALGDRGSALRSSRRAVRRDPDDWTAWYRLARLASGDERVDAAARVRELNPLAPPLDVRMQKR